MDGEGGSGEAGDGGQYLIGGFRPSEGLWLLVMGSDEFPYRCFQFLNAGMRTALDLPLCE